MGEVTFVDYEKNVFKTLDQIFSKVPDVDGFFFTTHILALEAFRYFYEKGININKGYELACIHGVSAFRVLAPNMNIARMPIEEIGKNAVRFYYWRYQISLGKFDRKKRSRNTCPAMFITLVMILHFFFNHLTGLVKINNDIKLTNVTIKKIAL